MALIRSIGVVGGGGRFDPQLTRESAPAAPTVVAGAAGLLWDDYRYRISFVTAAGETEMGAESVLISPVNQQVQLTGIPTGSAAVTARKIYRAIITSYTWSDDYRLVATINDNTTTTYLDNVEDPLPQVRHGHNLTGGYLAVESENFALADTLSTILGFKAGKADAGLHNVFIGFSAGLSNTIGSKNTIVGHEAASGGSMVGGENTVVGYQAGLALTSGYKNVIIGSSAGRSFSTGFYNVFIGQAAGFSAVDAQFSVCVGHRAGYSILNAHDNVCLGHDAGSGIQDGGGNICLGYLAGRDVVSGSTNIFIGNAAGSGETGSNRLYIGTSTLVYGEFDNRNIGINEMKDFGGGQGVFALKEVVMVPSLNPVGGGLLYVQGGALKYRGTSGTVTTIAPA